MKSYKDDPLYLWIVVVTDKAYEVLKKRGTNLEGRILKLPNIWGFAFPSLV